MAIPDPWLLLFVFRYSAVPYLQHAQETDPRLSSAPTKVFLRIPRAGLHHGAVQGRAAEAEWKAHGDVVCALLYGAGAGLCYDVHET